MLADYPCYHWMLRDRDTNASAHEFDPAVYYRNLQEVLDVVDEHTEPGPLRDRLYARWYRGKVLSRVGGFLFLNRKPQARRTRFAEIRRLTEQRFGRHLDAQLPFSLRVRSELVRSGTVEQLERLAELETSLRPRVDASDVRLAPDAAALDLQVTVRGAQGLLAFEVTDAGTTWRPPDSLAAGLPPACLDATRAFEANDAQIMLRAYGQEEEFLVPAQVRTRLEPDAAAPGRVQVALDVDARIATGSVAAGQPLRPGRYVLRAVVNIAGFKLSAPVTRGPHGVELVLRVDASGRPRVGRANWKQHLTARAPGVRRAAVGARARLKRAVRRLARRSPRRRARPSR